MGELIKIIIVMFTCRTISCKQIEFLLFFCLVALSMAGDIKSCKYQIVDNQKIHRCMRCQSNFTLNFQCTQCNLCSEFFINCNNCFISDKRQICEFCEQGFIMKDGKCVKQFDCSDINCYFCMEQYPSYCFYCMPGYKLNMTSYSCSPCQIAGAIDYKQNGTCSCPQSHFIESTENSSRCTPCGNLCYMCAGSANSCLVCVMGFTLKNSRCVPCPEANCDCNSSLICISCRMGYKLIQNKCVPSLNFHNQLQYYMTFSYQSPEFYKFCRQGCFQCSSFDLCFSCLDGYAHDLNYFVCVPCTAGCKHCLIINNIGCVTCNENLHLINGKCMQCEIPFCLKCAEDLTTCLSCESGYAVLKGSCQACIANCLKCNDQGPDTCDSKMCSPGYARISSKQCSACAIGCQTCSSIDLTKCVSCPIGSYLVEGGICYVCPQGCLDCMSTLYCSSCRTGYILMGQNCIQEADYPCMMISPLTGFCMACYDQYKLSDQQTCLPDLSCNTTQNCPICPLGYYLSYPKQLCFKCEDQQNCIKCNLYPNRCSECIVGYFIIQNQCHPCNENCTVCQLRDYCYSCIFGFYLSRKSESESFGSCLPCGERCLTCIDDSHKCNSCFPGMKLIGFTCISMQTIIFSITLQHQSINIESRQKILFIREIVKFTKFIAEAFGPPFSDDSSLLYLKSISSGSITVSYMASIENMNSLQALQIVTVGLNKFDKFEEFTVLDSHIIVQGFQQSTSIQLAAHYFILALVPGPILAFFMILMIKEYIKFNFKKKVEIIQEEKVESSMIISECQPIELDLKPMDSQKHLSEDIRGAISL